MFREFQRYDGYKVAGEWISEVPVSWGWEPARTIFIERKESNNVDEQMLSVTIGRGVIPQVELLSSSSKKDSSNLDKSKYKLVVPGDLVYNKMRAWQGAAGGSTHRGIVSPAYIVVTPRSDLSTYFHHLIRTPMFAKEAERWSYGITSDQWSLRPEHFKVIRFPVPPVGEQAAIVKYLAHANTRIDKAIIAKRRLIALLEEQAELQRATLFDGLGAPQRLATVIWEGPTNGVSPQISESGDLETFSISAVRNGEVDVRHTDIKYVERAAVREVSKYQLRTGDTLMVRGNGNIKLVGRAGLVTADMGDRIYPDLLMRLRFRSEVDPRFMVAALNSPMVREQVENSVRTAVGTYKLSGADIRGLLVPVPGLAEQKAIVRDLDEIAMTKSHVAAMLTREIALLQEFRTRLVADVVTGQVDVRAIAASLPDVFEVVPDLSGDSDDELDEAASD